MLANALAAQRLPHPNLTRLQAETSASSGSRGPLQPRVGRIASETLASRELIEPPRAVDSLEHVLAPLGE